MAHIFIKERYFWLEIGDLPGFQPECFATSHVVGCNQPFMISVGSLAG